MTHTQHSILQNASCCYCCYFLNKLTDSVIATAPDLSITDRELPSISKAFKINSKDLLFQNSGYAFQRSLQRVKAAPKGQEVQAAEEVLSRHSMKAATAPEDVTAAYNAYQEYKHTSRNCYCSPACNRSKRRYEIRQEKAYNRTCSAERRYGQKQQQALHIMSAGDRGYGFGSSIRGHVRLGGS